MDEEESNGNGGGEEVLGSSLTLEKVAAAKQFIENHYRNQMKSIQERKERCVSLSLSRSVCGASALVHELRAMSFHFCGEFRSVFN